MVTPLSVALIQTAPHDISRPMSTFADRVANIADDTGAQLIVFPELHLFGDLTGQEKYAEALDGPRVETLRSIAEANKVWLVPGTVNESAPDGTLHNTAIMLSPEGELVADYRKCFPWRPYEPHRPGIDFTVFDIAEHGRFAFSVCYDIWFPEVSRQLAWLGAEAIITPTRTTTADRPQEQILTRAHAITNQIYCLSCNIDDSGMSMIVGPQGEVLAEAGVGEAVLTATIDIGEVRRVREHGTAGLNRMWRQFTEDDSPIELPAYQGRIDPRTWRGRTDG